MNNTRGKRDYFAKKASLEGTRARSYYKLEQIDRKYKIFKRGMRALDLGASPGGWSLYLKQKGVEVVAVDTSEMDPIEGVLFIKRDVRELLLSPPDWFGEFDVVLSDMAPNVSGVSEIDNIRSLELCQLTFHFFKKFGKSQGVCIAKVFQSPEQMAFKKTLEKEYMKVTIMKPAASRRASSELYFISVT